MNTHPEFDYAMLQTRPPLCLLVEASAGTGKTYTLERVILYYLIQRQFSLDQILLVTFTNKATRELRIRIRSIIKLVLADPVQADKIFREIGLDDQGNSRDHLRQELANFSHAPIYTIHGFAQAMLKRFPMESESLIETRLDNSYPAELLRDFCRSSLLSGKLALPDGGVLEGDKLKLCLEQAMALLNCKNAEDFFKELALVNRNSWMDPARYLQEIPGTPSIAAVWAAIQGHWDALAQLFELEPDTNIDNAQLADLQTSLGQFGLNLATIGEIQNCCQRVLGLSLINSILTSLSAYKNRQARYRGVVNYDDLISQLDRTSRPGSLLLPRLQEQFRLVLIDEFQDTDQIQWEIFRRIAGENGDLIAVGDPKQAIYGFRGADLNTYLSARSEIGATVQLSRNYRSTPELVKANNQLFDGVFNSVANPRLKPRMEHPTISAGLGEDSYLEYQAGPRFPALNGLAIDLSEHKNQNDIESELFRHIGIAIQTLLSETQFRESDCSARNVKPSDICVLAQTNQTGLALQAYLAKNGFPSQMSGQAKLLQTKEAGEIQFLLDAIANPGDPAMVRRLALTRFFGIAPEILRDWQFSPEINACMESCARWHQDFQRLGLPGILMELEPGIRPRLLSQEGRSATRTLTNYRHIVDLFQNYGQGKHIPTLRLGLAFSELCQKFSLDEQETLRLASDAETIKIMTMHSAKGLEFPIVFLAGGYKKTKRKPVAIPTLDVQTDPQSWVRCIDPWNSQAGIDGSQSQEWEAWLRLFYVSVTRAQFAVFLPDLKGISDGKAESQLAIMYAEKMIPPGLLKTFAPADPLSQARKPIFAVAPELSLQSQLPSAALPNWRTALIKSLERQSSFTGLTSQSHGHMDTLLQPKAEAEPLLEAQGETESQPEPGGTHYGTIFHAAMEYIDFESYNNSDDSGRKNLVDALLTETVEPLANGLGFGPDFPSFRSIQSFLSSHIHLAMQANLDAGNGQKFPVHSLAGKLAYREADFHARLPASAIIATPPRCQFGQKNIEAGFLNGSIDFLAPVGKKWCIIDWKTNRCGSGGDQDLSAAMAENQYFLQALIYLSAVHQWQCQRQGISWMPNKVDQTMLQSAQAVFSQSIGPVWYVFARYGKAIPVIFQWEELLEFQQKAGLYAHA